MSETLETMLEAMPDSYQKTVGFPTYDLLAAAAIPMEELEAQLQETEAKLDPANLTGEDLERYVKSRSGLVRNPPTCASGILQVTGNGTVNEGDLFESAGGYPVCRHSHRGHHRQRRGCHPLHHAGGGW